MAPGLLSYYEVILGQREELRALVVAGECFERQAQAGTGHPASSEWLIIPFRHEEKKKTCLSVPCSGRWVGNSKHFLEEERLSLHLVIGLGNSGIVAAGLPN